MTAAPPRVGAPAPRVWAKGMAAARPVWQSDRRQVLRVICGPAPLTPTSSSSSSVPRLTIRLGLPGSESSDCNRDYCEDV
ncbi:hypothetical protein SORBI_3008G050200 [Sorghum bicolor]|uniref:Uncharacterized protein n=1 Tax=Sorghum bicolor TaxID=4558 RepID=A0A1B6PBF0_SORBI|nr:hypothetical protein SORBI_3008G050200 [Sorghum bicolor]